LVYTTGEWKRKQTISLDTAPDVGGERGGFQGMVVVKLAAGCLCGKASKNFEEVVTIMEMMSSLNERRAEFVYNAARLAAIAVQASVIPVSWEEREDAFKRQFLGVIERQCGERGSKSLEELHGGWMQAYFAMGWVFGEVYDRENKIHPDLVPYAQLDPLERDKDAVFVALCEIARQWIR